MKNKIELMNLFWTTAGIFPGDGDISRHDFRERVEAAARAGFKGIGIWHTDLEHTTLHMSLKEMKRILDDNGIKHIELEFLTDWFVEGQRRAESDSRRKRLLAASEALQAKHVKVGDFYNTPCTMAQVTEAFASLCKEAENYGATIGFEFMPSSMIDNLEDAITMVEAAGVANGGLVLDIVHIVNLGVPYERLSRIPLKYLVNAELNDGTLPGSLNADPSRARRFCGEGEYDIKGFIKSLRNAGYKGPWAVEVFSRELTELSLEELSKRAFETTIAEFDDQ